MNFEIDRVGDAILYVLAFVMCVSVHEFGHAFVATKLGDPIPRSQGRLTLSPLKHIDPIGTLLVPFLMQLMGAAGRIPLLAWGRPVETNPTMYTRRFSLNTGRLFVALAGPGMNLVMALAVSLVTVLGLQAGIFGPDAAKFLITHLVVLNLYLMFFNLLPIPPLDGGAVMAWFLPRSMQHVVEFFERWGFLILLGLLFSGMLGPLMTPAAAFIDLWIDALIRLSR